MTYDNSDAELIERTLLGVIENRGLPVQGMSDDEARLALIALARLVRDYLPEGERERDRSRRLGRTGYVTGYCDPGPWHADETGQSPPSVDMEVFKQGVSGFYFLGTHGPKE